MDPSDLSRSPTAHEILDEWTDTHPWIAPKTQDDWATMLARKMARLPREKLARRLYYDLYEFRVR